MLIWYCVAGLLAYVPKSMHDIVTCDPPWQPMEREHGVNLRVTLRMGRAGRVLY
jgi:hypothetical protein